MEFIDSAVLQRADDIFNNYSTTTRVAVWAVVLGEIIVVVREVASEVIWHARSVPIRPVLMCRWRHLEWVTGSWTLSACSLGTHARNRFSVSLVNLLFRSNHGRDSALGSLGSRVSSVCAEWCTSKQAQIFSDLEIGGKVRLQGGPTLG